MVSTISATATSEKAGRPRAVAEAESPYPLWFYLPAAIIFVVLFIVPTFASFYFSPHPLDAVRHRVHRVRQLPSVLQRAGPAQGLINTFIYGFITSGLEGGPRPAARSCCSPPRSSAAATCASVVFFPVLVSTIGIGITFTDPDGPVRRADQPGPRASSASTGPGWLTDPNLRSVQHRADRRLEGRRARHADLHRRHRRHPAGVLRGGHGSTVRARWQNFWHITLPLVDAGDGHRRSSCR